MMEPYQCVDTFREPISTAQSLCQRCSHIDYGQLVPSNKKRRPMAVRLGPASKIVRDISCCMCQVFDQTFRQRKFPQAGQDYYLYPFYTSHIHAYKWIYSPKLDGISETVSFAIVDDLDIQTLRQGNAWTMQDDIKRCGWISPLPISSPSLSFIPRQLDSKVEFDIIRGWLDFCKSSHYNTCRRVPGRPMLPIELIDCASRTTITTADFECSYVALSYVWGRSSTAEFDGCRGENTNGLSDPLPNVIEDAIIATQKLGFQYLWIDRCCIDQQDTKHKEAQIQQMDLIYSLASCTIVAVAGKDPTTGLPGVWTKDRKSRSSATVRNGCYISVPPDPLLKIKDSVWNSRGWTFQEAILSRRCIMFCDDQVYFTCGAMSCRDAMDIPLTALHRKNLQRFSAWNDNWNDSYNDTTDDNRLFRPITRVRYPFHECSKVIQAYTKRSLSDPDDILNGISGVLKRFKSVHQPFRQFQGIILVPDATFLGGEHWSASPKKRNTKSSSYTEQLATGLSWDVDRSYNLYRSGRRRHGFPSWSWTGWNERITALTEYDGYVSNTHRLQVGVEDIQGNIIDWEVMNIDSHLLQPLSERICGVKSKLT